VTRHVPGRSAWKHAAQSPVSRWKRQLDRFSDPLVAVQLRPKFQISTDEPIFCIGSCFARNIEEHLISHGAKVLSRKIISPREEWPNRVNGFINKFTTHSMRNELEWALEPPVLGDAMFEQHSEGWLDLQLSPFVAPVTLERAKERRTYLMEDYFARLKASSVVILTLGLNEVWYDHRVGRHLNAAPAFGSVKRDPERYELQVTDVIDNLHQLEESRQLILRHNAAAKIIVSVSPVPFMETFSGNDVMVANMYSKSTLRAAAEIFAQVHDNVDYFPSYDMVTMSPRATSYEADCRHVSDSTVGRVVRLFLAAYLGIEVAPSDFCEQSYLAANPDVEALLRLGQIGSGFEHWQEFGKLEQRPMH